ncbi:MAG TPA: OmpA family protein [Gemmatimonadaceae bacterium]|nr:OmpA family protein [Gemmatimonadaceae bacterium]
MRRLVRSLLILGLAAPLSTLASQSVAASTDGSLGGTREVGLLVVGRVLSTEYSVSDGRSAIGGAASFASHINRFLAVQGALGVAYSSQEATYYKPPLFAFTPILSLILQMSTANDFQPYALVGAGYEFIRYTHSRCDCEQSRSLGIGNIGGGIRKMIRGRQAFKIEASSQIGSGGPAFSIGMGASFFVGGSPGLVRKTDPRPPTVIRPDPQVIPPQRTTPVQTTPRPQPAPPPAARVIPPAAPPAAPVAPARNLAGTVLLTIDGTQVDFNRPAWRTDAEPLLDGLAVDLVSDEGERIKINIEAHTDNIGSQAGNVTLGLDRAKAVREFLINQGINADRITVSSLGGSVPVAANNTALGRQRNRRIVIRRTN